MMKDLVQKILLFVFPIMCLFAVSEALIRKIPNDYLLKRHYLENHADDVQVLILGSSHSYWGVNPEYLKLKALNAAYSSQDVVYDQLIFEKYQKRLHNLKYLVEPISYFSFVSTVNIGAEPWHIKDYTIYYRIIAYFKVEYFFEMLTFKFSDNWKRLVAYYAHAISPVAASAQGWGTNYKSGSHHDLEADAIAAVSRHSVREDDKERETVSRTKTAMGKLLRQAEDQHVVPILFTPPAFKTYVKRLNSWQLLLMRSAIAEFIKEYPHVVYADFLEDSDFGEADFYDADHLNELGAKKLTLKMDKLISAQRNKWNE